MKILRRSGEINLGELKTTIFIKEPQYSVNGYLQEKYSSPTPIIISDSITISTDCGKKKEASTPPPNERSDIPTVRQIARDLFIISSPPSSTAVFS